ncbi:hypothetical protein [Streptomyces sp. NPDC002580]|uniref:hypothetical protein n=1 Tax=Streptomyces sp. NPDC002580 TaxID=3364653 RepID=UPI0036B7D9AC
MTSSLSRSRSRRAPSHSAVRVAHAVLGGLIAVGWLVLPLARAGSGDGPAVARSAEATAPAAASEDGTETGDLVPPLVAVGAAGVLAAYTYTRRRRRATTRTTPGGDGGGVISLRELDLLAKRSLVDIDNCVRTGAEELDIAAARSTHEAAEPYADALTYAAAELAAAFRLRQRLDEADAGVGKGAGGSRRVLEEIVARCRDAGRRLDAAAPGFDQLRALERNTPAALESAGTRFRELAGRTPAAAAELAELHRRYAPTASFPVVGDVEQAKDRLVFTTRHLDRARRYADRGDSARAAAHLRAAEGAVQQAAVLVDGVDRLAGELASAAAELPAALSAAEAALGAAGELPPAEGTDKDTGGRTGPFGRAGVLLSGVRRETAAGPYDPLDALRRVAEAGALLAGAGGDDVLGERAHALLPAHSALAGAADYIGTHRGAVACEARTRLAEADRLLGPGPTTLVAVRRADELAREARRLAERDVRAYGHPGGDHDDTGAGGAVLGGILLDDGAGPVSYGGPHTRGRRAASFSGTGTGTGTSTGT